MPSVLVVDDEKNILAAVSRALQLEGYTVVVAGSAEVALDKLKAEAVDVIVTDVLMPGLDGIAFLTALNDHQDQTPVIMMSGHATIETAVEATRLGAHDFIEKPIKTERLLLSIQNALGFKRLADENRDLRQRHGVGRSLIGDSSANKRLIGVIERAAAAKATVLITGERGTGKELVATAIHRGSIRAKQPLQTINCAAIPQQLIESELFGHEVGAFTGATKARAGKFERAHQGTLFLDEVGDMPSPMQAKLLRVLQEGQLERVGGSKTIDVDVRIVAATNKDLSHEIEEGRFRADLFDRLNVVPIAVPALRDRRDDIEALCKVFLEQACADNGYPPKSLSADALHALKQADYPGNVRQLKNLIERLVIFAEAEQITARDVHAAQTPASRGSHGGYFRPELPLKVMLADAERDLIARALEHHDNHVTNTAAALGLERSHLYKKMKALGIRKPGGDD